MDYTFPFFLVLILSALFTSILIAAGHAVRWLLRAPSSERWHKVPTPSMGGVAMVLPFSIGILFFRDFPLSHPEARLFLGGFFIFGLGFVDDLRPLPAYVKLVGQIAAACIMLMLGIHVAYNGNEFVYIPLTIVWFVAITNAFNLLDNMDGLAGGVAFIAACSLAVVTFLSNGHLSVLMLGMFAASILGFLLFNVHPAKIFMGDCGSQWIGFMLAGFTVLDTWTSASNLFLMIATPVLILAVPIFDTALVTLNRKIHGRPVSHGGKDHASHRFVALGFSEEKTVWTLWGLAALFGLVAVFSHIYRVDAWAVLAGVGLVFALVLGVFLTDVKVYEAGDPARLGVSRWIGIHFFYKRRFLEILIDTFLIGGAYALSYLIRFDWSPGAFQLKLLAKSLPLVIGTKLLALLSARLYRGIWTYIDFNSLARLIRACVLASIATVAMVLVVYRFYGFSRTLFFIDFCVLLLLMGGTRAFLRGLRESVFAFPDRGVRVLVVGAGDAARSLLSEIRKNRQWNLTPVALLDDHPKKHGSSILGIRVEGPTTQLERWVIEKQVDRVILAIPSASVDFREDIARRSRQIGVPFAAMKSLEESLIARIR